MTPDHYHSYNYFVHRVNVIDIGPRLAFFKKYLAGKHVLHVGCTDWPIFHPDTNLHIKLQGGPALLDGLDVDQAGIEQLRKYVPGTYYTNIGQVSRHYDTVLAPEVLEHTLNPGLFLKDLLNLGATELIITAPNAIAHIQQNPKYGWRKVEDQTVYLESIHPDHCCYYSPMTLAASVNKAINAYTPGRYQLLTLFLTENDSQVGCILDRMQPRDNAAPAGRA